MRVFIFTRDNARVDEWRNFVVKAVDEECAKTGLVEWLREKCLCANDNVFEWQICDYCYARELVGLGDFEMKEIELGNGEFEMILAESNGG